MLTSQRVVDVVLRAFEICAASQVTTCYDAVSCDICFNVATAPPSIDGIIFVVMIVCRLGGKIIRTVLCSIVYVSYAQ